MKLKRTRLEVIRDILRILKEKQGVKITHLIYKANLSSNSIKPYLEELLKNNLIESYAIDEKKLFRITFRGNNFLQEFEKIRIFSDSYGL